MAQNHPAKPPERVPRTIFTGLFIANMAAMLGMGILLPLLSPFAKRLGASGSLVGFIFAGYALARGLASPVFGRLSDQYGRRMLLLVGLGLYAVLSLGYGLVQTPAELAVLWFFQGVASAMVTPIAQSYIGDITPQGKEGRVMNLFYLGQFGGVAIGPVISGYLVDYYSFSAPFYVMTAAAIAGFILIYYIVPEVQSPRKGEQKAALRQSFAPVIKDHKMKGLLSYVIGRGFYRWGFNAFFPVYAVTLATLSSSQVGLIISAYMITGTVLQYPFGRLVDRFAGCRPEFVALGGGIASVTTLVIPLLLHMSWLITVVILMGIFSAVSRASTVAIRTERGRYYGMGAVTGVYTAGFSAGQVLGPVGFGIITDLLNISAAFYIGAIIGLFTTALAFWLLKQPSDEKGQPAVDIKHL